MGVLTGHIQPQLALQIFTDTYPLVLARLGLLEVNDVVPRRTVAVLVESKLVPAQTLNVATFVRP